MYVCSVVFICAMFGNKQYPKRLLDVTTFASTTHATHTRTAGAEHSFSAIFLGSSMPACAISFFSFPGGRLDLLATGTISLLTKSGMALQSKRVILMVYKHKSMQYAFDGINKYVNVCMPYY